MEAQRAMKTTVDDERWDAVRRRDASDSGSFVYAVATTRVFCRPGCASRLPRRENVRFFDTNDDAKQAGFRACKRCKPDDAVANVDTSIVLACRLLEGDDAITTADVARDVGLSLFHFARRFKESIGVTPQAYRRRVVAERAKQTLAAARSVTSAIYGAGYTSSSRFYEGVGGELGMAPRDATNGARGQGVSFTVRRCSLGMVLIAWTSLGVCDVRFGDDDALLIGALRERFVEADVARQDLPRWVDDVVDLVDTGAARDLPLDIQGTAFQQRVWQALRTIPRGETRSYAALAASIGAPSSARAVARACATNNIAVLIPCHRVVRGSGDLAGYRWGVERKEALLRAERARSER